MDVLAPLLQAHHWDVNAVLDSYTHLKGDVDQGSGLSLTC